MSGWLFLLGQWFGIGVVGAFTAAFAFSIARQERKSAECHERGHVWGCEDKRLTCLHCGRKA